MTALQKLSSSALLVLLLLSGSQAQRKGHSTHKQTLTRADIKEAQSRLSDMGFGSGRNGLIAFQKYQGLKATGQLNRETADAAINAKPPEPKDTGYKHVEVDLDRQVLILTDDEGAIKKILPVSTGSNKQYHEKGMSGLAYTPRGRFRIYAKIAGWRKSPLGMLYYPNYFSDGLAIHGNSSVPNTPESHGCIRVPNSAAIDLYKQLPVGTIVLIYDKEGFVSGKDWADKTASSKQ